MPTAPRVVPVPVTFGQTGGLVYVYYIDTPQPALVDTGVAASPEATIEPALKSAGVSLKGGERISLGGDVSIEVVHTPGHSPGSVSFVLSGLDWAFTGDSAQVCGSAGFPLYADAATYGASQKHLLENVRPARLHMGHRFRALDGTPFDSVIEGPTVERALRDSLAMHERIVEAARKVTALDPANPKAAALAPAAEALGLPPDNPSAWPQSFFITMHGHLARAASPA